MSTIGANTSALAIVQLRCQSATAPTLATRAADAVAAHQCRERDIILYVTCKIVTEGIYSHFQICKKLLKSMTIFQLRSQMYCHVFVHHRVHSVMIG